MNNYVEEFDKDALGNLLVIGNVYGYANNQNGFTDIVVGRLKNVKTKASLEVLSYKRNLYNYKPEEKTDKPKMVSVRGLNLFPVSLIGLHL